MAHFDRRSDERKKVCVQIFATDLGDSLNVKCVVRDVNRNGCKIVSNRIHDLPEFVQLIPEGFDRAIRGRIVWRERMMAGVCFEHAFDAQARADIDTLCRSQNKEVAEDILDLGRECENETLSYSDRLKKYRPRG